MRLSFRLLLSCCLSRLSLIISIHYVMNIVLFLRLPISLDKSRHSKVFCSEKGRNEWFLLLLHWWSHNSLSVLIDLTLNVILLLSLTVGLHESGHAQILGSEKGRDEWHFLRCCCRLLLYWLCIVVVYYVVNIILFLRLAIGLDKGRHA